jgi:4-carboxymuconolactone decarboxylase
MTKTHKEAYERGLKTRRKVLGDEWVDRALKTRTPFNEDFQALITRYAWDEIWNRPGLDHRIRRMLVIAMCVAMGRWEEFRLHVQAALASGDLSADDLKEVLLQATIYCGVPAANHAFKEARDLVEASQARGKRKAKKA